MKFNITTLRPWLCAGLFIACATDVQAFCFKVTGVGTGTSSIPQKVANMGYTAAPWGNGVLNAAAGTISFGTISMGTGAEALAPAGTVIASADLPFLDKGMKEPYAANQIVFKCALSDAEELYEVYALPGGSGMFYGGKAVTDIEGAYQTPAMGIAYRITNQKTGLYYTGYWQERKLTSDDYFVVDSTLYIPASSFDSATFELLKTNDVYGTPTRNAFSQIVTPQAYEALRTSGINNTAKTGSLAYAPTPAMTSAVWSMRGGSTTIIHGNTCTLADFDQVVKLPPISVGNLRIGDKSSNTFNVAISCEKGAHSGTATNINDAPVAVGFLVTQPAALSQASTLGLQTSAGGISHLLDNNYGASGVASGVGIRLYAATGEALNLLSSTATTGSGAAAGWYGYADLMGQRGVTTEGNTEYGGTFTASLEQLPGLTAQAGSVNAQAQIIVSLQ